MSRGNLLCNSCVLTVLPDKDNRIFYYEGDFANAELQSCHYASIREIVQQKKKKVAMVRGTEDAFTLIIKNTDSSCFKNFVDIADEVTINGIRRYYIGELTAAEKDKIAQMRWQ